MPEYTREQLRELYKKLPQEIRDMVSADETTDAIFRACEENKIVDKRVVQISDLVRNVLFGLLPPEEFQPSLEKEAGLKKPTAKRITQEINRFVFFPVKEALSALYQIGKEAPAEEKAEKTAAATPEAAEEPAEPQRPDTYRESIE